MIDQAPIPEAGMFDLISEIDILNGRLTRKWAQ